KAGDIARHEPIDERARSATPEAELAHVRQVEEARGRTDGAVLGDDAFVLDRHLVAGERDDLRAERDVLVVKRRAPQRRRFGRHQAASLAAARARSRMSRYVSKDRRRRASSAGTQRTSSYS